MPLAQVRTGTMGWSYEDWRGPFYPSGLPPAKMLAEFAKVFDTVEIDATFFGAPRPATLASWRAQVPDGFLFAAKVPRAVTHERRLVNAAPIALDFGRLLKTHLGECLGALLLQLPPDLSANERASLDEFVNDITAADGGEPALPWVVEFRHASWLETNIAAELASRGVLCATTDRFDAGAPLRYVRLLGTQNSVARFGAQIDRAEEVAAWAARLQAARSARPEPILVYVRNFFEGHAPATIFALREKLGLPVPTPPGKQQMSLF